MKITQHLGGESVAGGTKPTLAAATAPSVAKIFQGEKRYPIELV